MANSNSTTDGSDQNCLSAIGIGRTGAGYVDGLLRTGEIEDVLMDPRARVAALVIDVGDTDLKRVEGYAAGLKQRLEEQGISPDHFHFQSISLGIPQADELIASLDRLSEGKSWLPKDITLPEVGAHLSRAVAKAIYLKAYNDEPRILDTALSEFANHVEQSELPSRVMVCFNLAGGTGSGMAFDLSRQLTNEKLNDQIPVIGVGQLPHSGDGDSPASLFASLNELDGMTKGQDDKQSNPFTGGFFVVNTEHSWQRLTSYTDTGVQAVRDRFRQEVTNKFSQDSFMRFAVRDSGRALTHALSAAEESNKAGKWMLFNLAKFTHPGVQVLPGEALSKWRKVINQWIDHLDDFSGLRKDFRSNYADVHIHAPREIGFDRLDEKMEQRLKDSFLTSDDSSMQIANHEFFDHLTSYADIVLPGLTSTDLDRFSSAKAAYNKLKKGEQKMCHSWQLEKGVVMSEQAQA